MSEAVDFYKILGVERGADAATIRRAYRKLAAKHHPDREGGDEASFKAAKEAYECLSDPARRAVYDQLGSDDGAEIEAESARIIFQNLVIELIEHDVDDVIAGICSRSLMKRTQFQAEVLRTKQALRRRERWLGRIRRKNEGANLAEEIIAKKIDDARKEVTTAEQSLRVNDLVTELTKEYEDIGDLDRVLKIGQSKLLQWGTT